jgi:hypothetical protein
MTAGTHDITIEVGATFELTAIYQISGVVQDITGWDARMQVRRRQRSTTALLDWDVVGGHISVDGSNGKVIVSVDAVEAGNTDMPLYGVYDLEIESPAGKVIRLLQGDVNFSGEVTR